MILFMAKSAACIGVVTAVASGVGVEDMAAALGRGVRSAAERAGQSCLRSDPCWRAGVEALTASAAARSTGPAPLLAPDAARSAKPAARPASG